MLDWCHCTTLLFAFSMLHLCVSFPFQVRYQHVDSARGPTTHASLSSQTLSSVTCHCAPLSVLDPSLNPQAARYIPSPAYDSCSNMVHRLQVLQPSTLLRMFPTEIDEDGGRDNQSKAFLEGFLEGLADDEDGIVPLPLWSSPDSSQLESENDKPRNTPLRGSYSRALLRRHTSRRSASTPSLQAPASMDLASAFIRQESSGYRVICQAEPEPWQPRFERFWDMLRHCISCSNCALGAYSLLGLVILSAIGFGGRASAKRSAVRRRKSSTIADWSYK